MRIGGNIPKPWVTPAWVWRRYKENQIEEVWTLWLFSYDKAGFRKFHPKVYLP